MRFCRRTNIIKFGQNGRWSTLITVGPVVILGSGQMSMLWREYNSAQT